MQHEGLFSLARDALLGTVARGIADRRFVADLLDKRLVEHPAYYGEMVWILMMLELWFAEHMPNAQLS